MQKMSQIYNRHKSKGFALGDQAVVSGSNFIFGIVVTRYAGLDTYGLFVMFWLVFLFMQGLFESFISLPNLVVSNSVENKKAYLRANERLALWLSGINLMILYIGFGIYSVFVSVEDLGYAFWLFPIVIVCFLKHETNRKYFFATENYLKALVIDSVAYLLQLVVLLIWGQFYPIDLGIILSVLLINGILANLLFYVMYDKEKTNLKLRALPWKKNWDYARFLLLTTILQWFSGNFLMASAGVILGTTSVGIIKIVQNLMGILNVLFTTLENVIPAKASFLLQKQGLQYYKRYIKKAATISGVVFIVLLLAIFFSAEQLLDFVYGSDFSTYHPYLQLFTILYLGVFVGTFLQLTIKTHGKNKWIFYAYVSSTIVSVCLAKPLIENFQIAGFIIGLMILQLINILVYFFSLKSINHG